MNPIKRFFIVLRCILLGHKYVSTEWIYHDWHDDDHNFYSNKCKRCDTYINFDDKKHLPKGHTVKYKDEYKD